MPLDKRMAMWYYYTVMVIDFFDRNRVVLAPMAGVTDIAFRTVCREAGAQYTYSEMVSAKALTYKDRKSFSLVTPGQDEHPYAVQIFGSDPAAMREGTKIAAELSGADVIDINMGCPMGKITSNGEGSALMRDLEKASAVIEAVVSASPVPVSVKMRAGWDRGSINCVELAQRCEQLGVSAVCIHGRTRVQLYTGTANWDWIRDVKRAVKIPVIANGDVVSARDARRILDYTGADAVMIGRASFGRPWLFSQIRALFEGEEIPPEPDLNTKCDIALRQFELAAQYKGEKIACLEARKHYAWYLRGVPYAGYYKEKITQIKTMQDIYDVTKGIRRDLAGKR